MPRRKVPPCPRCGTARPHADDSDCARAARRWGAATRREPDRRARADVASAFLASLDGCPAWVPDDLGGHYAAGYHAGSDDRGGAG